MSKREIMVCDRCKKDIPEGAVIHIDIPNGTTRESGGHKVEVYSDYEELDLCTACAQSLLTWMFSSNKGKDGWVRNRYIHPSADTNDAVYLALEFFKIRDKNKPYPYVCTKVDTTSVDSTEGVYGTIGQCTMGKENAAKLPRDTKTWDLS
jgi:hypothetical protein